MMALSRMFYYCIYNQQNYRLVKSRISVPRFLKVRVALIYLILTISINNATAQSMQFGKGVVNHINVQQVEMINPTWITFNKPYFMVGISVPFTIKLNLGFTLSEFNSWTFAYSNGRNALFGFGSSRVKLRRFGLAADYDIDVFRERLFISPLIEISYEDRILQQSEGRQIVNDFDGSNSLGEYKGFTEVEVFDGGQILPTIGMSIKLRLIKGLYFFGTVKWSIGIETVQNMFVNYSFLDEVQPTAHISDRGTAFIRAIGISYDLNIMKPILK